MLLSPRLALYSSTAKPSYLQRHPFQPHTTPRPRRWSLPVSALGSPGRTWHATCRVHRGSRDSPRHVCQAISLPEAVTAGLFAASTLYTGALGLLMVLVPQWERTKQLMQTITVLLPLAVVYGLLLTCSWEPDTFSLILPGSLEDGLKGGFNPQFFPELPGIMSLFSRLTTAASLWVHLLAINLFAARTVYLQGLEHSIPTWHSILLCLTLSPIGLLSHFITKAAWGATSSSSAVMP